MAFYKLVTDGYVMTVVERESAPSRYTEITESEFTEILTLAKNLAAWAHEHPAPSGCGYCLRDDTKEYEVCEIPAEDPEPTDTDKAEAYDIITGAAE